ncbi:superoxide dismutase [Alkalicaulis satelles]|uniref:superoxide dismutase n=1 Tax=Alkalicaulis satelles TaxID=2609175 RepID=A0A5M6ZGG5_9PROT|nr:superoxide dismutase [Alkalicaulis satelles]KAA5803842.1 superoxide dismutase [Alkalicaulis satelles]
MTCQTSLRAILAALAGAGLITAAACGETGTEGAANAAGAANTEGAAAAHADEHAADWRFELAPLPYAADFLEPVIDAETMEIHHGLHHQAYVNGLNAALEDRPDLQGVALEDLLAQVSGLPVAFRNHGGGHWNHDFFWNSMTAPGTGGAPSADFAAAIDDAFGSLDAMKDAFNRAGGGQFGSGWAWLIVNEAGALEITATPNQDNPLMDVAAVRGTPILGNDVWEHAYYLNYRNRRGEYLAAWWDVVDWSVASERFEAAASAD